MEEKEAVKENEQTLTNLSPAEEKLLAKMKSKLRNFCRSRNQSNTQYKTKSDLNAWKKFCELLKESRAIENIYPPMSSTFYSPDFSSRSVRNKQMALSASWVL